MSALTCTVRARVNGPTPLGVTFTYRLVDPVAIGITFTRYGRPHTWSVDRKALRDSIRPDGAALYVDEPAARVQLSTQPGGGRSLLTLHGDGGLRWLVSLPTAPLAAFLERTYQVCTVEREGRIVARELEALLGFMRLCDP